MWLRRPSLVEAVVGVLCGIPVGAFFLPTTFWALPIAVATAALITVLPQRPLTAGVVLSMFFLLLDLTGLTSDGGPYLAPFLIGVYYLGRYAPLWRGVLVALTFPIASMEAWNQSTVAFALVFTGSVFAYGRVVHSRAESAHRAQASAAELQATDATAVAARIVADERARLGGQSLGLLRAAVEGMRSDAVAARIELDPALIESVSRRGRQAVTELRWLLGILRSEPNLEHSSEPPDARIRTIDIVLAAVLILGGVLERAFAVWQPPSPLSWALAIVLPACVLVRRRFVTIACIVATAGVVSGLLAGVLPGLSSLLCIVLLAWSVGTAGLPLLWLIFAALAAASAGWFDLHEPGNGLFCLAVIALPAFAGLEWSAQDRAARAASAEADRLRADLEARVEATRREERLRIARELHDVASHSVGVMVMQASAASALRERDPAAARDALKTVGDTAEHTIKELEVMFDLLDSGAIGAPGLARATREPLQRLVDRMRKTGLEISLQQTPVPPNLDDVVYRIVQESLTNIVRHSNGRNVRIGVEWSGDEVRVGVRDDGVRRADPPSRSSETTGFGLIGLDERVGGVGGTFRAGWTDEGFLVEAVLSADAVARL
ncbi:histidine kinase [Microbacterium sp. ProA8]|uniref:sensor histidine kinase n=1 Tax=Microbacterium chionoecetis TaxID=3153754 RepID=UPI00326709B4